MLELYPQFFELNKISLVQKSLNKIGILPKNFHDIEILYLSNNNLNDISDIDQFRNLKVLTLAHNDVS